MLTPIVHVSLAIYASGRREGDETLLYCASQSCVMLDTLVIFLPFQSGFNPQSWPRLTEFRRPEDTSGRGTLVTLAQVVEKSGGEFSHILGDMTIRSFLRKNERIAISRKRNLRSLALV